MTEHTHIFLLKRFMRIIAVACFMLLAVYAKAQDEAVTEITAYKIKSDGFEFKSRHSAKIILTTYSDSTAWMIYCPDSISHNERRYAIYFLWNNAFHDFKFLLDITLPRNLSNIAPGAFKGCNNLRLIEMKSVTPPVFNSVDDKSCNPSDVFEDNHFEHTVIVVPKGCEQAYRQADGWERFKNITSLRPTYQQLGISDNELQLIQVESNLEKLQTRKNELQRHLDALRNALEETLEMH